MIENVHFKFHFGEVCVIKGENGSGKSTLLRVLSGLCEFTGELFLKDEKVSDIKDKFKSLSFFHEQTP
ncbi:ATP-binding cassette domain-containing protein [Bacillus sp. REN3]|uniref:ATP-binding cassette domain-containing protein n=1 Tax=Bacillus sp. REN3 TaxID=2802440 RepID=UPI001AEEE335|nr:ATP-binding cassette domain-containing protein [Bacillus sp. REN3]